MKDKKGLVIINGVEYGPISSMQISVNVEGLKYVIVRGDRAGVFAGYLKSEVDHGRSVVLINCRRIWYWSGAASLSQLAVDGTNDSSNCKFPAEVQEIKITDVLEIINCTEKARLSIKDVEIWKS